MLRNTMYRLSDAANRTIAPSLKYSQLLYEDEISCRLKRDIAWLDLGCGHHILPPWRQSQELALVSGCQSVVGLDPCLSALQTHCSITRLVAGDISQLPFSSPIFVFVPPIMVFELLLLRVLMLKSFKRWRTNIIAELEAC